MKKYKPTTPSRRGMSGINYRDVLTVAKPEKFLTRALRKKSGRSGGMISVRHRGGGAKRRYRMVDFAHQDFDRPARVETIEYDPNRTTFIARILYKNGKRAYVLAPRDLKVGDEIVSSAKRVPLKPGNRMPLKLIPSGTPIHNIELNPGQGGKLVRSAGGAAHPMAQEGKFVHVQLPSSEIRRIHEDALASIGELSNPEKAMITKGKAGRNRWRGIRPTVRGSAMNPVDHPLGGGEGRAPAGLRRPKNLWGKIIRGVKTRKRHKPSNVFVVSPRKKKPRK